MVWNFTISKGLINMAPSSPLEVQEVQAVQEVQESDLASYGGWHEQRGPDPERSTQASGPVPLLDEADYVSPEQFQQDRPWWMRPVPRMIFAGSAVMALVYVLFSWFGFWGSASVDKPAASLMPTDTAAVNQEVDNRIKQLQAENENLKRDQVMETP
jgi:cell division protein FtsB